MSGIPINVNIDSESINKMVAEAILTSVLGEALRASIDKQLLSLRVGYDNPMDKVVKEQLTVIVRDVLMTEYRDHLRAEVAKILADKVTDGYLTELLLSATDLK